MDFFTVVVLALVALVGCVGLETREPALVVEEGPEDAGGAAPRGRAGRAKRRSGG